MCVCVCVCVCVYVCVCEYGVCVCVCVQICVLMYMNVCVCVWMCMYVYVYVCMACLHISLRHGSDTKAINILVPGAGLGRLTHEFARRGYNCQGNEWSLFMLLASNFVLNK